MEPKESVEKVPDARLGSNAEQFIRAKPEDFVSGQSQLPIGRYHIGVNLQGGFSFGKVVFPVGLDDDPLAVWEQEQEVPCVGAEAVGGGVEF
jgi:hypothetical protein